MNTQSTGSSIEYFLQNKYTNETITLCDDDDHLCISTLQEKGFYMLLEERYGDKYQYPAIYKSPGIVWDQSEEYKTNGDWTMMSREIEQESFFEWGSFTKNESLFYEAELSPNTVYDIYFTVTGSQATYAYFELYNFTDDLDLALYQYNSSLDEYTQISTSQEDGTKEELIFKGLSPGDYILEISHYLDLDNSSAPSTFTVDFDSEYYYKNSLLPNDTLFVSQWHLLNTGQAGGIDNEDIYAPEAWKIRSTSPDVVVAVIDGGMQLDHPDLDDNLWINSAEIFGNGIDDDNNGYVDDIYGWNFPANSNLPFADSHGTHVAGIIGAEGNNGKGTTGVTWDTQLMSLDVFNGSDGAYDSDIIDAIYYAADNGADVINMSLGGTYEYTTIADWRIFDPNGYASYYEALSYAVNQGSTIVIAAGNEDAHAGTHLSIPAAFSSVIDGVISVAAISNTGNLTDYTNYGSLVTIAAPGGSNDEGTGILSTVPTGRYEGMPGTSMASPIVAGAAALIKAENPSFTPADIESIITNSADKYRDMSSLIEDGNYLNLKNALSLAQTFEPSPTPISTPTPELTPAPKPEPTSNANADIDIIIGNAKNQTLKATRNAAEIYGMNGNDKLIGSKFDDRLDGGNGNDKLNGKKGSDTYVLSAGKDKFQGMKLKQGDTVEIDSSFDYELISFKKHSRIVHDDGVTTVSKLSVSELTSIIEIV